MDPDSALIHAIMDSAVYAKAKVAATGGADIMLPPAVHLMRGSKGQLIGKIDDDLAEAFRFALFIAFCGTDRVAFTFDSYTTVGEPDLYVCIDELAERFRRDDPLVTEALVTVLIRRDSIDDRTVVQPFRVDGNRIEWGPRHDVAGQNVSQFGRIVRNGFTAQRLVGGRALSVRSVADMLELDTRTPAGRAHRDN